jgi:hypothetical protein
MEWVIYVFVIWEISGFCPGVVEAFSSGVLRRVGWRLATDFSGDPVGPIFKGPDSKKNPLVRDADDNFA